MALVASSKVQPAAAAQPVQNAGNNGVGLPGQIADAAQLEPRARTILDQKRADRLRDDQRRSVMIGSLRRSAATSTWVRC
jgi:hypothetical protein